MTSPPLHSIPFLPNLSILELGSAKIRWFSSLQLYDFSDFLVQASNCQLSKPNLSLLTTHFQLSTFKFPNCVYFPVAPFRHDFIIETESTTARYWPYVGVKLGCFAGAFISLAEFAVEVMCFQQLVCLYAESTLQ